MNQYIIMLLMNKAGISLLTRKFLFMMAVWPKDAKYWQKHSPAHGGKRINTLTMDKGA